MINRKVFYQDNMEETSFDEEYDNEVKVDDSYDEEEHFE